MHMDQEIVLPNIHSLVSLIFSIIRERCTILPHVSAWRGGTDTQTHTPTHIVDKSNFKKPGIRLPACTWLKKFKIVCWCKYLSFTAFDKGTALL